MSRIAPTLALLAALILLTACGGGGGPTTTTLPSAPTGLTGTLWVTGAEGYPLEGGPVLLTAFAEGPSSWAVNRDAVWAGSATSGVYRADGDGSNSQIFVRLGGVGIEAIAIGTNYIWAGITGDATTEKALVTIDPITRRASYLRLVNGWGRYFADIVVDGPNVYALTDSSFELTRIDEATRTVQLTVPLGQDPADPTGPRGDFFGTGRLAVGPGHVWVLDSTHSKLHKIDKTTLAIVNTADLSAHLPPDGDFDALVVGDQRVYVAETEFNTRNEGSIVAVDKVTGVSTEIYAPPGDGIREGIAANGDVLIVTDGGITNAIVDGLTGAVIDRLPFSTRGRPFVWVP
ncbi:MAG: hypothetical protein QNJ98_12720 [Planctomycetota bacterium]|nr:hypothetical protein [Planctomycetota bacterium]